MSIQVQLPDGNIGEFPDGMTHEQIEAVLKKQFPPKAEAQPNSVMGGIGRRVIDTLKGLQSTFAPPKTAAEFIAGPAAPLLRMGEGALQSGKQAGKQAVQQFKEAGQIAPGNKEIKTLQYLRALNTGVSALDPFASGTVANVNELQDQGRTREAVGQAIPDVAMLAAGSGKTAEVAKSLSRSTLDALAGTGPRVTKNLVKETAAANVEDAAKVAKDNEAAAAKGENTRQAELSKYSADTAKVEAKNNGVAEALNKDLAAQRRIAPTEQKLTNARSALRAAVETAREKALKIGNEKYNTVNATLNPIESQPEFYKYVTEKAGRDMAGSKGAPTVLKAMDKRAESGEPIRYEDLQADYSTLGTELSKGTLPGDVYHAYDVMHDAIGEEMQRIADSQGMGAHLADARNYWRRMKQTFGKPITFNDAATKAIGGVTDETQANQVRLLGSFDPEIPKIAAHVQNVEKGVEAMPKPVPERVLTRDAAAARQPAPKLDLTPRPEPKVATPAKVGAEEVQGAKLKSLQKRAGMIQHKALWIAAGPPIYALVGLMKGELFNPLEVAGASAAGAGLATAVARALDNPAIVEFLTKATPADVAQIPPELRGDFPKIVQAAQSKGIRVSPALLGIAATPKKRVAAALTK